MRLVVTVRTNRTFFTMTIKCATRGVLWQQRKRWIEIEGADVTVIQRKYLAAIHALEHLRTMRLEYDYCILDIDSKLITDQLWGSKSTTSVNIAELKSDLIGLMTSQGVTIEKRT